MPQKAKTYFPSYICWNCRRPNIPMTKIHSKVIGLWWKAKTTIKWNLAQVKKYIDSALSIGRYIRFPPKNKPHCFRGAKTRIILELKMSHMLSFFPPFDNTDRASRTLGCQEPPQFLWWKPLGVFSMVSMASAALSCRFLSMVFSINFSWICPTSVMFCRLRWVSEFNLCPSRVLCFLDGRSWRPNS